MGVLRRSQANGLIRLLLMSVTRSRAEILISGVAIQATGMRIVCERDSR